MLSPEIQKWIKYVQEILEKEEEIINDPNISIFNKKYHVGKKDLCKLFLTKLAEEIPTN